MPKTRALLLGFLLASAPLALQAQTPSPTPTPSITATPTITFTPSPTPAPNTTPSGQSWSTDSAAAANGARMAHTADGSTWFMTSLTDRIVRLQGNTMTEWPIRDTNNLGANPVDFQLDGTDMWFIENGESEIDAGTSIVAKLDTVTNELTEWVLPLSRPAGFYRAPNGVIWVAQSAGVIEALDLNTLNVTDYRGGPTVSYAGTMTIGPDGGLWITDFGNNRIVRHDMTTNTQRAWDIESPSTALLDPADARFDDQGNLWIAEFNGTRVDRFNPATAELDIFFGIASPLHLDMYAGKIYATQESSANGSVAILDPDAAPYTPQTLTEETGLTVGVIPPCPQPQDAPCRQPAAVRTSVIKPVTFTSTNAVIDASNLPITSGTPGILVVGFNETNTFGLAVDGGAIWAGTNGFIVRLVPQAIGSPSDQTVPIALQRGFEPDTIHIDLTLYNKGSTDHVSGMALYQFSAAYYPQSVNFDVGPGETVVLQDAFVNAPSAASLLLGSVRLQTLVGQASDLVASVRTNRAVASGGSFGFSLPSQTSTEILQAGTTATLFTGARAGDLSTFGYYSPNAGQGTAALLAPNGAVRATQAIAADSNVSVQYNPAASFFGVDPEPGDVIRVTVTTGTLQPYVLIEDPITEDIAISLPVSPSTQAVIPNVANSPAGASIWTSEVQIANLDPAQTATVSMTYYPIGGAAAAPVNVMVPPGGTLEFDDIVASLFQAAPSQGAILLTSNIPVAATQRAALRLLADGSEYSSQSAALDVSAALPPGGGIAIGASATQARRTNLLLFNNGPAGNVTVTAFDASGATLGHLQIAVGDHAAIRVNRVLAAAGGDGTAVGRILVEPSAGMSVYAQTVDIDGVTGDTEISNLR